MNYNEAKHTISSSAYAQEFRSALKCQPSAQNVLSGGEYESSSYFLPESMDTQFRSTLKINSILRTLGTVFTCHDSGLTIRTYTYDDYAQFIPEGRDIPITRPDKEFRSLSVGSHKLAVFYKLPIEFVHDSGFRAEDYIAKRMAKNVSNAENRAFLLGDGVIEPTGLLNDKGAEVGVTADTLSYDSIVDLFFSVKPEYRKKSVWIMNDKTALTLRKLKD